MDSAAGSGGVDSRASWKTAWLVLAILSVSYGSPLVIVVGMKPMQEALGTDRSVLALAGALVWVGTGSGGILMGWLADRIERAIEFLGALDAEQRSRLLEIANQCPVHRTLSSKIDIKTTAV